MRLTCPECGAMASAASWQNDAAAREFIKLLVDLPNPLGQRVLPYLGLFRLGGRGLTWSRARRLLADLIALVKAGQVHIRGGEERPAPIAVWAAALDAVYTREPRGLKNHNYLRKVAWEMAAPDAAKAEANKETKRREAWRHDRNEDPEPLSKEEFEEGMKKLFSPHPDPLPEGEGDGKGACNAPLPTAEENVGAIHESPRCNDKQCVLGG